MNPIEEFAEERHHRIASYADDRELVALSRTWRERSMTAQYVYNFDWAGLPIIQYPQDIVALQELVWAVRPDLIIETGIARGGSLALSASLLALLDYCDAAANGTTLDPKAEKRAVLGVDIDIRTHNREAIERHPLRHKINMIQGSSIASETVDQVWAFADRFERILVCLDSNHTHDHVLAELEAYAPLVAVESYCVVFDTLVEDLPAGFFSDRPWDVGDNPMTAVREYLSKNPGFEVDQEIERKLQITVAPEGYLRRVK